MKLPQVAPRKDNGMKTARKIDIKYLSGIIALCLIARVGAQPPLLPVPEPPSVSVAPAPLPDKALLEPMLGLLNALEEDRYADFAAMITDEFRAALPPEAFREMRGPIASRLQKGYDLIYMGEINKGAYTTFVLKIVFRDRADEINDVDVNDVMVTFTIRDAHQAKQTAAKVAGFSLD